MHCLPFFFKSISPKKSLKTGMVLALAGLTGGAGRRGSGNLPRPPLSHRAPVSWVGLDLPGLAARAAPLFSLSLQMVWSQRELRGDHFIIIFTSDWSPGSGHHSHSLWSPHYFSHCCRAILSTSLASLSTNYSQIMGRDTVARSRGGRAKLGKLILIELNINTRQGTWMGS